MSDNLNKVVEEILDDYLEYDENGNSFMNSEEFEKLTDGKYERYDPRDRLAQALTTLINNEKIAAVNDALAKSGEAKQPPVSKPLTLDRLKDLVGGNLRKNEPDYGRRQFVMGYNQAKDEIRERILTW